MRVFHLVFVVALASAMHLPEDTKHPTKNPCRDVLCRAGRECINSGGDAQCLCVTSCPEHDKPVCGDDGLSYDNYCLLHQRACLTGEHIAVDYRGYCKADIAEALREFGIFSTTTQRPLTIGGHSTTTTTSRPVTSTSPHVVHHERELSVCYGPQRDALRDSVIATWQRDVKKQPWYTEHMTYMNSLSGHFYSCDKDTDYLLRPDELLDCFREIPFSQRPEQDQLITKTLCIDAMVEEIDSNRDWKLDYHEFSNLLNPLSQLVAKNCSLEGKVYTDGAEVKVTCNHCVCATGSWVCATHDCDDKKKHDDKDESHVGHKSIVGSNGDKSKNSKDVFGYMDNKYDLEENKKSTDGKDDEYDYGDEYYDEYDYDDDDESTEKFRTEEAKKEFDLLSDSDKKTVTDLENKIQNFYHKTHNVEESNSIVDATTTTTTSTTTSTTAKPDSKEYASEEEDLIAREDNIVEQYDELLQKSRIIRERLQNLRSSLTDLEKEKQNRHHLHIVDHHHAAINEISHEDNDIVNERRNRNRKQKKYEAYIESMLSSQQHNRRVSQIDNDIWEDQWKSKISKHSHDGQSNHL